MRTCASSRVGKTDSRDEGMEKGVLGTERSIRGGMTLNLCEKRFEGSC